MADRYWVGGNGSWTSSNTTNWSTISGGAGGATVPGENDVAWFDANSFFGNTSITVTIPSNISVFTIVVSNLGARTLSITNTGKVTCRSIVTEGSTGNWQMNTSPVEIMIRYRNFIPNSTGVSDLDIVATGAIVESTSANNKVFRVNVSNSSSVTWDVDSSTFKDLNITSACNLALNYNATLSNGLFVTTGASISGAGTLNCIPENSADKTLTVNGTVSKLNLAPTFSGQIFRLSGVGTISYFTESVSIPFGLKFSTASNLKFSTWSVEGTSGNLVSVSSDSPGVKAKVTKLGGGTVSTNYMNVRDIQAYPDITWISYNSTNSGNNYQWYFNSFVRPTSNLFFGGDV